MTIGNTDQLWGQHKVSAAEAQENENLLSAKRVTEIPTNMQMRADYGASTDGLPNYMGYAPKGMAEGTDGWLLQYFVYDGNRQCTSRTIAYGNWTNRASESYS